VPDADIDAALAQVEPETNEPKEFIVEPENRDTVRLYLALQTQWRVETGSLYSGSKVIVFTRRHGIDYGVVPVVAKGLRIRLTPDLWDALRQVEQEAISLYDAREEAALRGA
jgi:hypothetical protein